ncbi:MAG: NADH-quinone oxidoreductase subunit A [Nitrososphaeria archaeon]|nr:NADH-quinone oxidoreductase subunit A [Aigarchaeota archaeon]MCX8187920.1 NADH-quinone oxidoreductase subunit A [Nitrososphaeria archaeon]MDW8021222.1 NADH-quinone oxidoreductase subunit A [Nitrososphaerota archaeon]
MEVIIALTVAALTAISIYLFGRSFAPKTPQSRKKLESYSCGESLPPARGPIKVFFFNIAALFMVFDVVALLLAFTINIPPVYKQELLMLLLVYCLALWLSIYLLVRR